MSGLMTLDQIANVALLALIVNKCVTEKAGGRKVACTARSRVVLAT